MLELSEGNPMIPAPATQPRPGRSPKVLSRCPSHLHPRIALTLTGDARVKVGGAIPLVEPELSLVFPHVLRKSRFSLIVRRRQKNASVTTSAKCMTATAPRAFAGRYSVRADVVSKIRRHHTRRLLISNGTSVHNFHLFLTPLPGPSSDHGAFARRAND